MTTTKTVLDHPTLPLVKAAFPDVKFLATEFRGQTTLIVPVRATRTGVLRYPAR